MVNNLNPKKVEFINLIKASVYSDSQDLNDAKDYLNAKEINIEDYTFNMLNKIKQFKYKIEALKTEEKMRAISDVPKQKATEWVEKIMNDKSFSLKELIRNEQIVVNFRNIEDMENQDIKEFLILHYTLKFEGEDN
jgi:hypothetical protein